MVADDLFTRFQQRLTAVGGEAYTVANFAQAADLIAAHPSLSAKEIVVPPHFEQRPVGDSILPLLRGKDIAIIEAGEPASVADAPAGLTDAELAIAETGSVLLAENSLAARVVSMLTLTHFVLLTTDKLVPMLDDAAKVLQQLTGQGPDQRHYMSFVTGPSRTADIERTLTIGVQGPKALCVIVVNNCS
ncbi:MAG: lactate utilization protein C [Ktedonobacteraceae bacterium]